MSEKFKLDKHDLKSIAKSVVLAAAGAALAYLAQDVVPNLDLGKQAWVIPLLTVGLNAAVKWIRGQ